MNERTAERIARVIVEKLARALPNLTEQHKLDMIVIAKAEILAEAGTNG